MGIYDRDYMREGYVPPKRRGQRPPKRRFHISFPLVALILAGLGIGALFFLSLRTVKNDSETAQEEIVVDVAYPLDLNTATFEELMTVPQIGPATAEQIVNNRPFEKLEGLLEIYGIGDAKLSVFAQYLTIGSIVPPEQDSDPQDTGDET